MSIILDVALVIVFLLFVVKFTRNGFGGTIIRIGKAWISLFFSLVLTPFVANRLYEWVLFPTIKNGVNTTLIDLLNTNPNEYNLRQLFVNLPEGFLSLLNYFGISLSALEFEYGSATEATEAIVGEISNRIAAPCSKVMASIFAYIITFVVSLIFFAWWNKKLRQHNKRPAFFRRVDGAMGFIFGTAVGLCAVFGISMLVYTIFQLIIVYDASSQVFSIYDNSYIFKFMKELDVIGIVKNVLSLVSTK